ncbi:MAG TPA: helix-turn-helix transcriptional regulator [Planctomycetota bacterium]|nr:helix-turn-helix transcriptional regulator [Planctomycetota bacterium]
MDPLKYLPPLRATILFTINLGRGAVPVATLARLAEVAPDRAQAFGSILVARKALVETEAGYIAGPAWAEWSGTPTRARPNEWAQRGAVSDQTALATIDAMRRTMADNVRALLAERGWSLRELARRSGLHPQYVSQLTRYSSPPPACHLVLIARVLGTTVEQLASSTAQMQPSSGR